jgi:arylsulfatase A-like enzyme
VYSINFAPKYSFCLMKKFFYSFILGCFAPCLSFGEKGADKPNVVLILVDDLGWQDVGIYDIDEPTPMETPNIDALAKKGVLFRQGYSPAPTCAPTRCAMMSGRHAAALQKTHVVGGNPTTPYNMTAHPIMDPWYSGRLEVEEVIIPEALKKNGYVSGHIGKWHMSLDHHSYPQPMDQGFDFTKAHLGESAKMKPHRLTGFATSTKNDPYQLDADGFPKDQPTLDAIEFMEQSKSKPFFLYYAAWLVHTPIHSRSKELLEKYCKKLGVDMPTDPDGWPTGGQTNPYYCAMVEMLDHYIGMLVKYLEKTEDPRNPGKKLIDNTYILFTSDNGGMERVPGEEITDNYPLDRGKINAREGGVRVPFIITGPGIGAGQESDVMVNGLDFYPTILSWTGTRKPKGQNLDGADLSTLLSQDPTDHTLVKNKQGEPRTTMMWHFPHGVAQQSTLRVNGWKLIHNWMPGRPKYELFELYKNYPGTSERADIEEEKNLASKMPEKVAEMSKELFRRLEGMNASYPFLNPSYKGGLPHKEKVCQPIADSLKAKKGNQVSLAFKERGAKVTAGQLMYTTSGKDKREEWYRAPAKIKNGRIHAKLPKGTTHYFFNLIDENNFLVSYPEPVDMLTAGARKPKGAYSWEALEAN